VADRRPDQLITAYGRAATTIRSRMVAFLTTLWDNLTDHRSADAAQFIRAAVPVVAGAQQQTANLTAAYLSTLLTAQLGRPVPPVPVRPQDIAQLRGVPAPTLYQRPFTQVYTDLSQGVPYPQAVDRGRARLVSLAETDVQLAKTHTAQRALDQQDEVEFYRRVLTGSTSCGLCVIASTQRYHAADLLPIHPGCDCAVAPILGGQDPGQVIDQALLDAAHAAIAERFGRFDAGGRKLDYRKVLVTHEHGEIGPVLAVAGHRFTGPDDINTDTSKAFRQHGSTADTTGKPNNPDHAQPDQATDSSAQDDLATTVADVQAAVDAGTLDLDRLYGGQSAATRVATLPDGRRAVHKAGGAWEAPEDAKQYADAEELASLVGHALEVATPAVQRDTDTAVWMEWAPGDTIGAMEDQGRLDEWRRLLDSRDGRLVGLLDALIGNADRNSGNLIVGPDGRLRPIDHGFAWGFSADPNSLGGLFADRPLQFFVRRADPSNEWIDNPLTRADVAEVRRRLEALRPEFTRLGRADWLTKSLSTLDQLAEHATGTEPLLDDTSPGGTP
jgi:hypothetical protein